jgi:hypothetical protein
MGARLYDRENGRFLSPDPIIDPSQPDSLGGYTYAGDDPVNSTDWTGLMLEGGGGGVATASSSSGASASVPPAQPTTVTSRAADVVNKKLAVFSPSFWKGVGKSISDAWQAGSDYVTSIPNKSPAELLADMNTCDQGFVVGVVGVVGDMLGAATDPITDLGYVLFNTPEPPRVTQVLTSAASAVGIKTDSVPFKAGQMAGTVAGTVAITALTAGAGAGAEAGAIGAEAGEAADAVGSVAKSSEGLGTGLGGRSNDQP